MQKIEVTYFQMVMIGLGVGFVLGLIPLALGFYKGKRKLAIIGFLVSIIAGAAWSLFSLISVIVFVWLILRKSGGAEAEAAAEVPALESGEASAVVDETNDNS